MYGKTFWECILNWNSFCLKTSIVWKTPGWEDISESVTWPAPGEAMSSLNIQVWWWAGSFSPLSIIKQACLFSLTQDRCKKTAHAFPHKPARTLINIPHEEVNFCITPFWELWHGHDEGLPPISLPFVYSTWCSSVPCFFFLCSLDWKWNLMERRAGDESKNQ